MLYFSTFGYIKIQPSIYDLQAFYNSNKERVDNVIKVTEKPGTGITFEEDINNNVVCAFTIVGDTYHETEKNYDYFMKVLKENFPSAQTLVRVRTTETADGSASFFNKDTLNPFPDWSVLAN